MNFDIGCLIHLNMVFLFDKLMISVINEKDMCQMLFLWNVHKKTRFFVCIVTVFLINSHIFSNILLYIVVYYSYNFKNEFNHLCS